MWPKDFSSSIWTWVAILRLSSSHSLNLTYPLMASLPFFCSIRITKVYRTITNNSWSWTKWWKLEIRFLIEWLKIHLTISRFPVKMVEKQAEARVSIHSALKRLRTPEIWFKNFLFILFIIRFETLKLEYIIGLQFGETVCASTSRFKAKKSKTIKNNMWKKEEATKFIQNFPNVL